MGGQYDQLGQPINYGGNVNMAMYPGPVNDGGMSGFGGLSMVPVPPQPQLGAYGPSMQQYGAQQAMGPNGAAIPAAGAGGWQGAKDWFSNGQNLGVAIQGFGTLASAYLGFQQMKQAKEGLKFQKEAFNANLGNSIKNYNTTLEDRIRGRTSAYEGKENDVSSYLAKHQLKR